MSSVASTVLRISITSERSALYSSVMAPASMCFRARCLNPSTSLRIPMLVCSPGPSYWPLLPRCWKLRTCPAAPCRFQQTDRARFHTTLLSELTSSQSLIYACLADSFARFAFGSASGGAYHQREFTAYRANALTIAQRRTKAQSWCSTFRATRRSRFLGTQ